MEFSEKSRADSALSLPIETQLHIFCESGEYSERREVRHETGREKTRELGSERPETSGGAVGAFGKPERKLVM